MIKNAARFANQWSLRNLEDLLHGPFPISWDDIADNLWVNPNDFIGIYRGSDSRKAFHHSIVKLEMDKMKKALRRISKRTLIGRNTIDIHFNHTFS